ncbi:hypothetical protein T440DRAFT_556762 [Plenodomus tracheiphilus IPT5]|uniref:Uncharacterized protein n=1 Tax=Plenodomus tracheiphilus IPT5 TaxID=1408161 RepID=A0A6A7B285_9PLEO|nr:hypothetical protein T440DRAFT_556762 [Plenodomus tracheiphilus IPT5]
MDSYYEEQGTTNANAGRQYQYPTPHNDDEDDAYVLAMLDEHIAFTLNGAFDSPNLHSAPWSPTSTSDFESEYAFDFTTPPPRPYVPLEPSRPSSSGTIFVDWDESGGKPVVSYRNGTPSPKQPPPLFPGYFHQPLQFRPQVARQGSNATMFVDLDGDGGVQVSYRESGGDTHLQAASLTHTPNQTNPQPTTNTHTMSINITLYPYDSGTMTDQRVYMQTANPMNYIYAPTIPNHLIQTCASPSFYPYTRNHCTGAEGTETL